MNTYKTILNTVVEPLTSHGEDELREWVARLKQSDGEGWAVGEMLERALRYITMTLTLAEGPMPDTASSSALTEPDLSDVTGWHFPTRTVME